MERGLRNLLWMDSVCLGKEGNESVLQVRTVTVLHTIRCCDVSRWSLVSSGSR